MGQNQTTEHLALPAIVSSPEGWGPLNDWCPESFKELNIGYSPYSKMEKLGKAADWTNLGRTFPGRQNQGASIISPFDDEDEQEYSVIDSRATQKSNVKKGYQRGGQKTRARVRGGAHWQDQQIRTKGRAPQAKAQQGGRGRGRGGAQGGYRRGGGQAGGWNVQHQRKTSTSVDIEPAWNDPISVIDFNNLVSAEIDAPEVETIVTYGTIKKFSHAFDKLAVRQERPLERNWSAEMKFYSPTTSEDPVIQDLVQKKVANVYATDSILVVLMSVLRSAYAFDIVVTKDADGNIFLDKRDDFLFDYLSVNENSNEPPYDEAEPPCNSVEALHKEATIAQHNVSQQVLFKEGESNEFKFSNPISPFASSTDHLPSVAYQYKVFNLGENTKICVRTEVDSFEVVDVKGVSKTRNILVKSLLEYDQKVTGGWRQKLENQKAGCFATELKSNNCKLTKWLLQAYMAGATNIKLAWISRTNGPKDPYVHSVLAVTDHPLRELQSELGIDLNQIWGALKYILNIVMRYPAGSYILLRDPNRKNIHVYKTSPNEFRKGAK